MNLLHLPRTTDYDPAEDPPGSVDPLGTVVGAEQLAEVILPGLTARMWRARLLTYAALTAAVARQAAGGREDRLLDARLAFERLFVSAMARQVPGEDWKHATRRLPGIGLARQALRSSDQPLRATNFLKGQAANGPFGVISRLARDVGAVDESGELGQPGVDLLLAWSEEQDLPGLLDDGGQRDGGKWLRTLARKVADQLDDPRKWPPQHWPEWGNLAGLLRLDDPGKRERKVLRGLLSRDPLGLRNRVIDRLESRPIHKVYRDAVSTPPAEGIEYAVLGELRSRAGAGDEVDAAVRATIDLIVAYESVSGSLETAFRGLLWGLTRHHGQAARDAVTGDRQVKRVLAAARSQLDGAVPRFRKSLTAFEADGLARLRKSVDFDRMHGLADEAATASADLESCVTAVLARHRRVQGEKGKGVWLDEDRGWTLMPGFGDASDEPARYDSFIHRYRVTNVYSILADLDPGLAAGADDGEAEDS